MNIDISDPSKSQRLTWDWEVKSLAYPYYFLCLRAHSSCSYGYIVVGAAILQLNLMSGMTELSQSCMMGLYLIPATHILVYPNFQKVLPQHHLRCITWTDYCQMRCQLNRFKLSEWTVLNLSLQLYLWLFTLFKGSFVTWIMHCVPIY